MRAQVRGVWRSIEMAKTYLAGFYRILESQVTGSGSGKCSLESFMFIICFLYPNMSIPSYAVSDALITRCYYSEPPNLLASMAQS